MKAIAIAFSTYTKIPMPHFKWDSKALQYSMCAFPLVGLVIGIGEFAVWYVLTYIVSCSELAVAVVLTLFPMWLTGGIHMDGFLDTVDAKNSYKSKEEKLEILKDPHTGAFAIIRGCMYVLLYFGCMTELLHVLGSYEKAEAMRYMGLVAAGFLLERILSGLSVLLFRKAKKDGMAATTAREAKTCACVLMWLWLAVGAFVICSIKWTAGLWMLGIAGVVFVCYRRMAYRTFGGITGDLAGYFLQMCELWMLLGIVCFVHGCRIL